jgi:hypothetical protein
MSFEEWVELAGKVLDATGVLVITVGIFVVTAVLTVRRSPLQAGSPGVSPRRRAGDPLGIGHPGRGDIIRSVGVTPTFHSVGVLALIVVVRTLLSFSLRSRARRPLALAADPLLKVRPGAGGAGHDPRCSWPVARPRRGQPVALERLF